MLLMASENQRNCEPSKDVWHGAFHTPYIKVGTYLLRDSQNYRNLYAYPFTVELGVDNILYIGMLVAQFYPSWINDIEQSIVCELASDLCISSNFGEVFSRYQ